VTAEAILPHVRRLLRLEDAEAVFVRAENPAPIDNYMPVAEAALAAAREYVSAIQERFVREGARAKSISRLGTPASVILDVVQDEKATLVAMATHGRSGLERLLFGSVAGQVVRKSPVPVLAVRPFWSYEIVKPDHGIRNILVPLDGSAESRAILPQVAEFAGLFGARAILLHALGKGEKKGTAEAELERAADELRKEKVESISIHDVGKPAKLIQEMVRAHDVDLVAMATHRSELSRLFAGSVTEEVLRQTRVPMLIVSGKAKAKKKRKMTTAIRKGRKE
jgi:nucleotide-binding universal stress UspA family protein